MPQQVFSTGLNNYIRLQRTTGTLVKNGVGVFVRVIQGISIVGTNSATLYDGIDATGDIIITFNTALANSPLSMEFDIGFSRGLYVVTSGLAVPDLCIVYR